VAPANRAQLARAALEKRARTCLSAAVAWFVCFYPGGYLKHENTPSYIKQKRTFLSALLIAYWVFDWVGKRQTKGH
jgi:hypothetical protein